MYKNGLFEWVGGFLVDELQEWKDGLDGSELISDYPQGIVGTIFEPHFATGSYTCCAHDSREWVKEYFKEIEEYVYELREYQRVQVTDVWDSVEGFQLDIMYHACMNLVGGASCLNGWCNGNKMVELLDALIEEFKE